MAEGLTIDNQQTSKQSYKRLQCLRRISFAFVRRTRPANFCPYFWRLIIFSFASHLNWHSHRFSCITQFHRYKLLRKNLQQNAWYESCSSPWDVYESNESNRINSLHECLCFRIRNSTWLEGSTWNRATGRAHNCSSKFVIIPHSLNKMLPIKYQKLTPYVGWEICRSRFDDKLSNEHVILLSSYRFTYIVDTK